MKKILIIVFFIGTLCGCRKGPNDPLVSFRSREQRITGDWQIESANIKLSFRNILGFEEFQKEISNGRISYLYTRNGLPGTPNSSDFRSSLHLEKDGTFTYSETTFFVPGQTEWTDTRTGHWSWEDAGKKKSAIKITNDFPHSGTYLEDGVYMIDELRNDKLVLKRETNETTDPTQKDFLKNITLTFQK